MLSFPGFASYASLLISIFSEIRLVAICNTSFRLGGMVVAGSIHRTDHGLEVQFDLTDTVETVTVIYRGILPDLFAENSGVVATGKMQGDTFVAGEVLAKHDENYMPPEVAKSMKENNRSGAVPSSEQYNPAERIHETETLQQ